jgi:hypothetical protein
MSGYFTYACSEACQGSTLRLLDVDVEAFNSYVCWVNRKVLAIDYDWEGRDEIPHAVGKLVTLWLLADRLADAKLRNAAMDAIIGLKVSYSRKDEEPIQLFPPHMTVLIWSTLAKGRALRRLVIDHYVEKVEAEAMKPHWDECHAGFIKSLAMEGLECAPFEGEAEDSQAACDELKYHEHVNTGDADCEDADYIGVELFHYE